MKTEGWETRFRSMCAVVMVLMALFSVVMLMVLPKSGGDAATWTVIGVVMASSVFAMAVALLWGQYFGVKWVRQTARWRYYFAGVFALFGIAAAVLEPHLSFVYYPAFAAVFIGQIFREEQPDSNQHGIESSHRQRLALWSGVLFAGSVGGMVWMVLAILTDAGAPINMAMLVFVLLWSGGFLTAARLYGFRSGKRDREQGDVLNPLAAAGAQQVGTQLSISTRLAKIPYRAVHTRAVLDLMGLCCQGALTGCRRKDTLTLWRDTAAGQPFIGQ